MISIDPQMIDLLNEKALQYETLQFIDSDPILIPHQFTKKEDIEIAGFLAATLAWGQRKTIIKNAQFLMTQMDLAPHDFILNFSDSDLTPFENFKHRTFNFTDLVFFFKSLQNIYHTFGGLEEAFWHPSGELDQGISQFKSRFFSIPFETRTTKHVSDPLKGSASKRLVMYLRWMIRSNMGGVDFGIWKKFQPPNLMLPLDVHTAGVSRNLGLLSRKQNDWKAVVEISNTLRQLDPNDPIKYDFALFGLGVFEGLSK